MSKEQEVAPLIEKVEAPTEKSETAEPVQEDQVAPAVKVEAATALVEKETQLLKAKKKKNRISFFHKSLPKSTESVEKSTEGAAEKVEAKATTAVENEAGEAAEKVEGVVESLETVKVFYYLKI